MKDIKLKCSVTFRESIWYMWDWEICGEFVLSLRFKLKFGEYEGGSSFQIKNV